MVPANEGIEGCDDCVLLMDLAVTVRLQRKMFLFFFFFLFETVIIKTLKHLRKMSTCNMFGNSCIDAFHGYGKRSHQFKKLFCCV